MSLPINHLSKTLNATCNGLQSFNLIRHDDCFASPWNARVVNDKSGVVFFVKFESGIWSVSASSYADADAAFLQNRLNGLTRDDSGNTVRLDSSGRDVTGLTGLHDETDTEWQIIRNPPLTEFICDGDEWLYPGDGSNWQPWLSKYAQPASARVTHDVMLVSTETQQAIYLNGKLLKETSDTFYASELIDAVYGKCVVMDSTDAEFDEVPEFPHDLAASLTRGTENEANAALIARAPELEAALRDSNAATLRWMEQAAQRDNDNAQLIARVAELEQLLRECRVQLTFPLREAIDEALGQ